MTIGKVIKELFEGEEVKDYLCENAKKLHKWQIRDMVAAAPTITLERKLEIYDWLAKSEKLSEELAGAENWQEEESILQSSYMEIAKNTRAALEGLHDTDGSAVFLVEPLLCLDENSDDAEKEDTVLFTCYEKAAAYMRKMDGEFDEDTRLWYNVEKWEFDEKGDLKETWSYTVVKGQVLFFYHPGLRDSECAPDPNVNLPLPFQAGDIIEVHDLPFARKRRALIVDVGDNADCCCIQEVHVSDEGDIVQTALKHGFIFEHYAHATSPLFRAKIFRGTLEREEAVLEELKRYRKRHPKEEGQAYLWKEYVKNREQERSYGKREN